MSLSNSTSAPISAYTLNPSGIGVPSSSSSEVVASTAEGLRQEAWSFRHPKAFEAFASLEKL